MHIGSKHKWPVLFTRFIDDGFGIFEGTQEEVEYWINQFNLLRETIKIDKWSYGTHVEYMDLEYIDEPGFLRKECLTFDYTNNIQLRECRAKTIHKVKL